LKGVEAVLVIAGFEGPDSVEGREVAEK